MSSRIIAFLLAAMLACIASPSNAGDNWQTVVKSSLSASEKILDIAGRNIGGSSESIDQPPPEVRLKIINIISDLRSPAELSETACILFSFIAPASIDDKGTIERNSILEFSFFEIVDGIGRIGGPSGSRALRAIRDRVRVDGGYASAIDEALARIEARRLP